jgi:hypothetical protein
MRSILMTAIVLAVLAVPAIAQDAQTGKEYDITIETEQNNQYTGAYGEAKVGTVNVDIPNAKKGEKYHVKVTAVAKNQYTDAMQASCDFQQTGGNSKGMCLGAP